MNELLTRRIIREKRREAVRRAALRLLLLTLLTYGLFGHVFGLALVNGDDMLPGVKGNSLILFYRLDRSVNGGDMVVVKVGGAGLLRRAVAVGGDLIDMDSVGDVKINGLPENAIYAAGKTKPRDANAAHQQERIEEGSLYLLGDNREESYDSRDFGAVNEGAVIGKLVLIIEGHGVNWFGWLSESTS